MQRLEKLVDRFNRWGAFFERLWTAFSLLPLLGPAIIAVVALASVWAARASPFIQSLAPFSYVVGALIVGTFTITFVRAAIGRRNKLPKVPRVEQWVSLESAAFSLANDERLDEHLQTMREQHAAQREFDALQSYGLLGMLPAPSGDPKVEAETSEQKAERYARQTELMQILRSFNETTARQLAALRRDVQERLLRGDLVAKGYRGTLTEHDQEAALIPASQWMVLRPVENNTARGDGIAYSGVQIGKPISLWQAFLRALGGQPQA
jgi:hypothetical protein